MGIIQSIKNLFGGDAQEVKTDKHIVIDTYSPVDNLISKKEMKGLAILHVSGPARAGKGIEILSFLKSICKKHNTLHTIDLSGVIGMAEIPEEALRGCTSLKSVTLPKGILAIKNDAFEGCSNLETVALPEGLERIHEAAFANCPKLCAIKLPHSLYRLGKEVFSGDDSITKIVIPSKVESIGTGALNCQNLAEITVEPHNPSYISADNVLYSRNGSALVKYAGGKANEKFTIPANVAKIVEEAFYECRNLKQIEVGNNVNIIGDSAFKGCENISSIALPASVACIGDNAFENCTSLAAIRIVYGVTKFGNRAFKGCSNLESIELPNSLVKIGDEAFSGCSKLKSCALPGSVEVMGRNIFQNTLIN